VADLFKNIPAEVRLERPLNVPPPLSEIDLTRQVQELAACNHSAEETVCFLGGGAYDHFIPAVVDAIAGRSEFYTAYTPYQPEVSQGTLQATFEFQTAISELTGLRPGDLIVRVNGEQVSSQAEFYRRLWMGSAGQDVQLVVQREARLEAITVRSVDRYRLFQPKDR
jgi:glycine dehydrogenase subunit 1